MAKQFETGDLREGDVIEKREWSGESVLVVIDGVYDDVKNDRPGFDGEFVRNVGGRFERTGRGTWGYMGQVVRVVSKAVSK